MTDDMLTRLRHELVEAAQRQMKPSDSTVSPHRASRWRRPTVWVTVAAVLIGVPAVAAAAGMISFADTGQTPNGTYTIGQIADDRASTDPDSKDGIGRSCDTIEFRDNSGRLLGNGGSCRPRDTADTSTLSAGFSVTPGQMLLIHGSASTDVARIIIEDMHATAKLGPVREDARKPFSALVPIAKHTVIAYDGSGDELDRQLISP